MKSIKFLTALAIPAMFAACTNEEIATVETPLQMQEVVGAELVGTDISLNASMDGSASRLTSKGWQKGDQLGLGWIVTKDHSVAQDYLKKADKDTLFANHLFINQTNGSGDFTTYGNVYKGWHFAYWPYERMDAIDAKIIEVNPEQTAKWSVDRYANKFQISALHFLEASDLDEDNKLKQDKPFKVVRAVNEIAFLYTPKGGFVTDGVLNNLKVENIQLSANAEIFSPYAKLNPTNLPTAMDKDSVSIYAKKNVLGAYDEVKTLAALRTALKDKNVLTSMTSATKAGYAKTITTVVTDKANMVTGAQDTVRIITLPKQGALTTAGTKIKIEVENGSFEIKYVKDAVEGTSAATNNKAIEDIIAAYAADGTMTQLDKTLPIYIDLYEAIFAPNFDTIDNYEEWEKAVALVDALGTYNEDNVPVFTITGDILVDSTAIAMPKNCGVKISANSKKDIITQENMSSWPANLDASDVDVVFDSNVTLADASAVKAASITVNAGKKLTLKSGKTEVNTLNNTIVNNGTIVVQKNAKVATVTNNGRIEVVYGSYVTVDTTVGTVAYVLTGNDKAYEINNLINGSLVDGASVNTLVVNSGKTLNLGLTDPAQSGVYDPYTGVTGYQPATPLDNLSAIAIEMNGGSIVGVQGGNKEVGAVSVLKGTNTITDVIPASITVAAKATLNIDATKDINGDKYELDMTTVTIENAGTLNVETITHIDTLNNTGKVDATGYKLHCYTTCNNTGTAIGDVKVCDEVPETPATDYEGLELDVTKALNDWKDATTNSVTVNYVVDAINQNNGSDLTNASGVFYTALKNWYDAKVADGVLKSTLPAMGSVTASHIDCYQLLATTALEFEE